jgi:tetratricopeptide (TPR) repeat protein
MKSLALFTLALAAVPSIAAAQAVEEGYPRGSLAVAAIERGDWQRAEALLATSDVDREDPALLINLGEVYFRTGRTGEALATWQKALDSNRHADVETMSGRWVSTRVLAREAIGRYQTAMAQGR